MENNTYLSDDEVDIENEQYVELDQYGMPIEEVDEEEELEMRKIISNKLLSRNSSSDNMFFGSRSSKKESKKDLKSPKKKTMSLEDLNSFVDKEIEDKKPKKFISKRSMDKKVSDPSLSTSTSVNELKRKFNPRKIPYLFSDEYKNLKKSYCELTKTPSFDSYDFPTL